MASFAEQSSAEHHRNVAAGGPRALVFGASDGLITNASLILGFAGAATDPGLIRLAGFAGLAAGAFSMAAGELVSMQAQRELLERELAVEREALLSDPEEEERELAAIYVAKGLDATLAADLAKVQMRDPALALEAHAREELGIDPAQLGSPLQAAVVSFAAFAVGAIIPLLPWMFASGKIATWTSIGASACAAFGLGAVLGVFTGRSRIRSGLRSLGVAVLAASATWLIGLAVGVHL
ncbi:MAG: VIT1/CCC1 transporter family protein [Actinomycetota bacterium]